MKVLLDENIPHELRPLLVGREVFAVAYRGWRGVFNGELMRRAASKGFQALMTKDSGFRSEHKLTPLPLSVLPLRPRTQDFADMEALVPKLLAALANLPARTLMVIPSEEV